MTWAKHSSNASTSQKNYINNCKPEPFLCSIAVIFLFSAQHEVCCPCYHEHTGSKFHKFWFKVQVSISCSVLFQMIITFRMYYSQNSPTAPSTSRNLRGLRNWDNNLNRSFLVPLSLCKYMNMIFYLYDKVNSCTLTSRPAIWLWTDILIRNLHHT